MAASSLAAPRGWLPQEPPSLRWSRAAGRRHVARSCCPVSVHLWSRRPRVTGVPSCTRAPQPQVRIAVAFPHPRRGVAAAAAGASSPQRQQQHEEAAAVATEADVPATTPVAPSARSCVAHPPWVATMNAALDAAPLLTLLAFVAVDAGSALCLWAVLEWLHAPVDGSFAAAYALSKSIRVQRLPLDAAAAGALAKAWPALAAVRVSRLLDAAARLSAQLLSRLPVLGQQQTKQNSRRAEVLAAAGAEARRLADEYGLAYMAAKNVIGPVSIALFYAALVTGADVAARLPWLAAASASQAGVSVGRLALASWTSTLLFPGVVMAAARGGLLLHAGLQALRSRRGAAAAMAR